MSTLIPVFLQTQRIGQRSRVEIKEKWKTDVRKLSIEMETQVALNIIKEIKRLLLKKKKKPESKDLMKVCFHNDMFKIVWLFNILPSDLISCILFLTFRDMICEQKTILKSTHFKLHLKRWCLKKSLLSNWKHRYSSLTPPPKSNFSKKNFLFFQMVTVVTFKKHIYSQMIFLLGHLSFFDINENHADLVWWEIGTYAEIHFRL